MLWDQIIDESEKSIIFSNEFEMYQLDKCNHIPSGIKHNSHINKWFNSKLLEDGYG